MGELLDHIYILFIIYYIKKLDIYIIFFIYFINKLDSYIIFIKFRIFII